MVQEVPHAATVAAGSSRHVCAAALPASAGRTPPRFSGNLVTGCFGMKLPRHEFSGVAPGVFRAGFRTGAVLRLTRVGELTCGYGSMRGERKDLDEPEKPQGARCGAPGRE